MGHIRLDPFFFLFKKTTQRNMKYLNQEINYILFSDWVQKVDIQIQSEKYGSTIFRLYGFSDRIFVNGFRSDSDFIGSIDRPRYQGHLKLSAFMIEVLDFTAEYFAILKFSFMLANHALLTKSSSRVSTTNCMAQALSSTDKRSPCMVNNKTILQQELSTTYN